MVPVYNSLSSERRGSDGKGKLNDDGEANPTVQFSCSVMSNSLRPHESQHARPPCPSPTPGVQSDSRPSSQWCHPAISSWVVPFSSCPQSLPASESFPMSQLFAWGGQSTGVGQSPTVLPKRPWLYDNKTKVSQSWNKHCLQWATCSSEQKWWLENESQCQSLLNESALSHSHSVPPYPLFPSSPSDLTPAGD